MIESVRNSAEVETIEKLFLADAKYDLENRLVRLHERSAQIARY